VKKWGQNFLRDKNIAGDIVTFASLKKDDVVLEIGPGQGVLTGMIGPLVKKLVAIEIDPRLISILNEKFSGQENVEIVAGDILTYPLPAEWRAEPFKVIANIPYYITSPIVFLLLDWHKSGYGLTTAILMVQEEVARRLAASPGGKEYGVISILLQLHAEVEVLEKIPAAKFFPVPRVNSALIRISFLPAPRVALSHTGTFVKIVKASFAQRRKTIYNSLKNNYGMEENVIGDCLRLAGIDARRRAETLSIDEFATLSEVIHAKQKSNL